MERTDRCDHRRLGTFRWKSWRTRPGRGHQVIWSIGDDRAVRNAAQQVDGVDLVFFITLKDVHHIEGKQIDYAEDRRFFLRDGPKVSTDEMRV